MRTYYEWDYETLDGEDVTDHNHADSLSQFTENDKTGTLVLVRNEGSENGGLQERSWAYVKDGKLPEFFSDARGALVAKVPHRFHQELAKYLDLPYVKKLYI